jgi:hypothetical protein
MPAQLVGKLCGLSGKVAGHLDIEPVLNSGG